MNEEKELKLRVFKSFDDNNFSLSLKILCKKPIKLLSEKLAKEEKMIKKISNCLMFEISTNVFKVL
jgi:hypothetical protein